MTNCGSCVKAGLVKFDESRIAKLLLDQGLLDQFQYQSVRDHQSQYGGKFHMLAVKLGIVPEEKMTRIVAQVTGCQQVSLDKMPPDPQALDKLPGSFCVERIVYPCALRDNATTLWLAMADPTDTKTRTEAQVLSGLKIRQLAGQPSEIKRALERDYGSMESESIPFVSGTLDFGETEPEHEVEFKVTDLSGSTAVKHISQIGRTEDEAARLAAAGQRLDRLLQYQDKMERILEKVLELFVEKGLMSADDLHTRMKK